MATAAVSSWVEGRILRGRMDMRTTRPKAYLSFLATALLAVYAVRVGTAEADPFEDGREALAQ